VPSENLLIVRKAFEIFNRYFEEDRTPDGRDRAFAKFAELASADFEYREPPEWPGAQSYEGLDRYKEVLTAMQESLEEQRAEIEESFEADDRVLVYVRWWARGAASGAEAELRPAQIFTFRKGKICRQEIYMDRAVARKAFRLEPSSEHPGEDEHDDDDDDD
jgi:ketosteroid isomerase-like protein